MLLDRFEQQPNESRVRRIDFSARLLAGETITNASAVAELVSGTADDSGNPFVVGGVVIEAGATSIKYTVFGGASGNTYKVTFTTTTSTPQIREDEIHVRVREI